MNIVLIDKEKSGGIEMYNRRLYSYLTGLGHTVSILRFAKKDTKEKHIIRIPYYIGEDRMAFTFVPSEKTLTIIKNHLKKIQPDIVYTCIGLSPFDFFMPALCHELQIPLAGVWHTDINDTGNVYTTLLNPAFAAYVSFCKQLDMLHVFSSKLANYYKKKGVREDKISIIPNGINTEFYQPGPSAFAKQHNFTEGILFLGRLTFQKNPELVIKAFLKSTPSPTTKLVLVGGGDKEEELREKYQDERIIFTGKITSEEEKLDIIRSCQIFVLPSKFEGMSLALLEAMAVGLACIITDAGSNAELLQDAGIIISVSQIKSELLGALRILLQHPTFIKRLGEKARKRAIIQYEEKKIFGKLVQELDKTIRVYKKSH